MSTFPLTCLILFEYGADFLQSAEFYFNFITLCLSNDSHVIFFLDVYISVYI